MVVQALRGSELYAQPAWQPMPMPESSARRTTVSRFTLEAEEGGDSGGESGGGAGGECGGA